MKTIRMNKTTYLTASDFYTLRHYHGIDIAKVNGRYELTLSPAEEVKTLNVVNQFVDRNARHA